MKKSQFFSKDFILLFLINLLGINFCATMIIFLLLLPIVLLLFVGQPLNYDPDVVTNYLAIFSLYFPLLVLPLSYWLFEKYSKNELVLGFIYNLRHSWRWKIGTLIIFFILPPFSFKDFTNVSLLKSQLLFFSGFASYLALYLWWEIEKLYKKFKKKEIETNTN